LLRVLRYLLDEGEFLSAYGVRGVSKRYEREPSIMRLDDQAFRLNYAPAKQERLGMMDDREAHQ
jgi:hypothetical protein